MTKKSKKIIRSFSYSLGALCGRVCHGKLLTKKGLKKFLAQFKAAYEKGVEVGEGIRNKIKKTSDQQ